MKLRSLLLILAITLVGCGDPADPETALRETIDEMQRLAQEREGRALLEYFAEDFVGNPGGYDKTTFGGRIRAAMVANTRITATMTGLEVNVVDNRATASFNLLLTGSSGRLIPERGRLYSITTGWRMDEGEWRLIRAKWDT